MFPKNNSGSGHRFELRKLKGLQTKTLLLENPLFIINPGILRQNNEMKNLIIQQVYQESTTRVRQDDGSLLFQLGLGSTGRQNFGGYGQPGVQTRSGRW